MEIRSCGGQPTETRSLLKPEKKLNYRAKAKPKRIFDDSSFRLQISSHSFNTDAARLWNRAPVEIKTAITINAAKAAILNYVKSFPV